jgi:hypothetical protein
MDNMPPLTPPEAMIIASESPFRLTRLLDMFFSRGDFDPRQHDEQSVRVIEYIEDKKDKSRKMSEEAARARIHAWQTIRKTNDISDTLREMRG